MVIASVLAALVPWPLLDADGVGAPPKPVYWAPSELPAVLAAAVADTVLLVVVRLTRTGSCAPQGLFVRQALAQAEFPWPQLFTHWLPNSVHSKYGMVCENWEAFGEIPLLQIQEKVKSLAVQSLAIG